MLKAYKPESALLSKFIAFFYVFDDDRPAMINYLAFPHVNTGVSFFKNVQITRGDHEVYLAPVENGADTFTIEILGKYTRPVFVHYLGRPEEIAIIFKPYGINQFVRKNLAELTPNYSQELLLEEWKFFAPVLFGGTTTTARLQLLEEFLLKNLEEIANDPLYKALTYLEDFEKDYTMDEIAALIGQQVKTFQRHFIKNMGCTPAVYRRIARFRASVTTKLLANEVKSLTSLAYETSYYDQSYFIREFKKLTHLKPKKFFEKIALPSQYGIIWEVK